MLTIIDTKKPFPADIRQKIYDLIKDYEPNYDPSLYIYHFRTKYSEEDHYNWNTKRLSLIEYLKEFLPNEYETWKNQGYSDDEIPYETFNCMRLF